MNENIPTQPNQRDMVGIVLMGSEEAQATLAMLRENDRGNALLVSDTGCYYKIEAKNRLEIDLTELSERMGRKVDVPTFLVIMSSYYGRISIDSDRIIIHSELLGLEGCA